MKTLIAIAMLIAMCTNARADAPLAYQTIQPSKIVMGESAILRITSLDSELQNAKVPEVAGLSFEVLGHSRSMEFINGTASESSSLIVRVTPQLAGIFSIPGLTPKSQPLILEVDADRNSGNLPLTLDGKAPRPPPPPAPKTANAAGIHFVADGSAFVQLKMPKRGVYVGESVPVDIIVGVRPGLVTALNGLPTIKGGDFTLNNLSRQPERQEEILDGKPFLTMTWHSVLAAVKAGDFSLTVETPLTVKISNRPSEDAAFANLLGGPFLQNFYNGIVPREMTVESLPADLHVLPLPTDGRPADFSGAVGAFKISSDVSSVKAAAGDPLTLRLHVAGTGNFDRVDSPMLDRIEHWKTYPPKSSFTPADPVGYKGEKIFEQPLIASQIGEQTIPGLSFSYFDPETRHYERAQTAPIQVDIGTSLADNSLKSPTVAKNGDAGTAHAGDSHTGASNPATAVLKADHPPTRDTVNSLIPLYLQPRFLVIPAALALLLAGGLIGMRRKPRRAVHNAALELALARLNSAARSGDSPAFLDAARALLLQDLAHRWQMPPQQITTEELAARLGSDSEDICRLFALADEAKYSRYDSGSTDFSHWLQIVNRQLSQRATPLPQATASQVTS
jgi:hypothetical protein